MLLAINASIFLQIILMLVTKKVAFDRVVYIDFTKAYDIFSVVILMIISIVIGLNLIH